MPSNWVRKSFLPCIPLRETEDIARSTVLRITAIACLSIEELEVLGSMEDDENIDEEEDDGEWVDQSAQLDGRNAFDMFDDEVQIKS